MILKNATKTSRYLYSASGASGLHNYSMYLKYLSRLLADFKEVGAPIDPERPNTYSRVSQLIATYDSYLIGVEPELSLEFITNIYPFRVDLRIIPMCSHGSITRQTEDCPSSYGWLRCDLDCRCIYSSLNCSGIIRLLSMDRTNGYEHSYRSLANQSFESTTNSLTVHSTRLRTLGNFPGHGSLSNIYSSRYFSDTF